MVAAGDFREDLWFRLSVFPIAIPPLRQRRQDIPDLVHHFLQRKSAEMNIHPVPELAPGAMPRLVACPWRGNVRELENVVERALIQYEGGKLTFDRRVDASAGEAPPDTSTSRIVKLDSESQEFVQGPGGDNSRSTAGVLPAAAGADLASGLADTATGVTA